MNPPRNGPNHIVTRFVARAEPVFQERFNANCCLNSTWVCLEVLRRFGLRADPLSVRVVVMNARWVARMRKRSSLPSEEEIQRWVDEGGWCLAVDTRTGVTDAPRNAWAGHLVAIVQKEWLLDCSVGQMSRPQKDIDLPSLMVTPATRRFLRGKEALGLGGPKGAMLNYVARLDDLSYRHASGFAPSPHNIEAADEIEQRMRHAS